MAHMWTLPVSRAYSHRLLKPPTHISFCFARLSQKLHTHLGTLINTQPLPELEFGSRAYNGHRPQMHAILYEHALSLGVEIRLGQKVVEYWEDAERARAGVVTEAGERVEGDVVVGADGVHGRATGAILVKTIFRAFIPT